VQVKLSLTEAECEALDRAGELIRERMRKGDWWGRRLLSTRAAIARELLVRAVEPILRRNALATKHAAAKKGRKKKARRPLAGAKVPRGTPRARKGRRKP